jgi:response regulator NasT
MRDNNVFVAFSNKKVAVQIAKIVIANGMNVVCLASNLAELKKYVHAYGSGIIVCGYRFNDDYIVDFIEDVPSEINIIMVGNRLQLEECTNDRVFKLAVPLQRVDLVCSLNMLASMDDCIMASKTNRNHEEDKIIREAKRVLIGRYSMTEEQAHRYIQKKSMDTGKRSVEIAKIVLSE